jgi:hypothetical protein
MNQHIVNSFREPPIMLCGRQATAAKQRDPPPPQRLDKPLGMTEIIGSQRHNVKYP